MKREIKRPHSYFIGGVNGVGKSTFLKEVVARHPEFSVVKGSAALMEWLDIEPGDYESLRKLTNEFKHQEFDKMMEDLLSQPSTDGKVMLIDAHYFHYKRGEMIDTTGDWMSMVSALFIITADTDIVLKRVAGDSKDRDLFPLGIPEDTQRRILTKYLEGTIQKAQEISDKYRIPFFVLENTQDDMDGNITRFLEAHMGIIDK